MSTTTVNPTCFHMSASSIQSFKACPTRFRLAYREGLRVVEDTESQRFGNGWHGMNEAYANELRDSMARGTPPHPLTNQDEALCSAINYLDDRYANVPNGKTVFEWKLERQILLTSFLGYLWYYQNDPLHFYASELPFNLPLTAPRTGLPLLMNEVQRVGKIDHIVRWQGAAGVLERKSTTRSIADDSDYWDKAKKDTQVSMYALAFHDMPRLYAISQPNVYTFKALYDRLEPDDDGNSIPWFDESERVGNTLYDVWHRPTTKPTTLTQAETAQFLSDGKYMGSDFKVEFSGCVADGNLRILIDGEGPEITPGKKGIAIRETIEMYGARLMQDIYARPEFYFRRREIARTDADIKAFRKQLFSVYQAMKLASKYEAWVENEAQCRATFPCPFIPVCYGPGADAVCDGKTTPNGFKRIFVDLTVNGETIDAD